MYWAFMLYQALHGPLYVNYAIQKSQPLYEADNIM